MIAFGDVRCMSLLQARGGERTRSPRRYRPKLASCEPNPGMRGCDRQLGSCHSLLDRGAVGSAAVLQLLQKSSADHAADGPNNADSYSYRLKRPLDSVNCQRVDWAKGSAHRQKRLSVRTGRQRAHEDDEFLRRRHRNPKLPVHRSVCCHANLQIRFLGDTDSSRPQGAGPLAKWVLGQTATNNQKEKKMMCRQRVVRHRCQHAGTATPP